MIMKNVFLKNAAAAALLTLAGTGAVSAATVVSFRSSGDYGCASAITGPDRIVHMCVYGDRRDGQSTAFLNYYSFNLSDGGNFMQGYGEIPSSSLHATGNSLTLSVVPSTVPGFVMDGAGHEGAILIVWKTNGIYISQSHVNSTRTFENRNYRERWNGAERSKTADTSGAFLGSNFPGFNSNFGSTTNMQITIEK